jgi:hypothetical protein
MKINRKNILYMIVLSIILPGLLFSCNRENKTGALTWTLNDGTLTISGKGPMPNYGSAGGPWCNLKNEYPYIIAIIINDGVINIGNNAFVNIDTVVYVSIPDSVTTIGENAFIGCSSITSIIIPDSVITIDNAAFQGCSKLVTIDIPDSVLNIGKNAFMNCFDLLNVTLGKNVAYIGFEAFYRCKKIQTVTSNNPIPPHLEIGRRKYESPGLEGVPIPLRPETGDIISDDTVRINTDSDLYRSYYIVSAFDSVSEKCRLIIPDEYLSAYKEDEQWNKFYDRRSRRR